MNFYMTSMITKANSQDLLDSPDNGNVKLICINKPPLFSHLDTTKNTITYRVKDLLSGKMVYFTSTRQPCVSQCGVNLDTPVIVKVQYNYTSKQTVTGDIFFRFSFTTDKNEQYIKRLYPELFI